MKKFVVLAMLGLTSCATPSWSDKTAELAILLDDELDEHVAKDIPKDIRTMFAQCIAKGATTLGDKYKCPLPPKEYTGDIRDPLSKCLKDNKEAHKDFRLHFSICAEKANKALVEKIVGKENTSL